MTLLPPNPPTIPLTPSNFKDSDLRNPLLTDKTCRLNRPQTRASKPIYKLCLDMCRHKKLFILQSIAWRNFDNPYRRHCAETNDRRKRRWKEEGGGTKGREGSECGGGGGGGVKALCEGGEEEGNFCFYYWGR